MKRFASIKDCSRFSALCDLPETFFKKISKNFDFFPYFPVFSKMFPVERDGFLLFLFGEEWFSRFMRIPSFFEGGETPSFFGFVRLFSKIFKCRQRVLPSICFDILQQNEFKKSQRVPSFRFFGTVRLLKILFFKFFFENFSKSPMGSPSFFWNFATEWLLKNLKGPPFTVFGIVRNFRMNNFCLKNRFSEAQHAISEFCFFSAFFYATFF